MSQSTPRTSRIPRVVETPAEMADLAKNWLKDQDVGFVPTMGALHAGHASLLKLAREQNDFVVLSIFVNPTQFNDVNDFSKYPKTWDEDLKIAAECGVDVIFAPQYDAMYPDKYRYKITEAEFSKVLCGGDRPGHFDGVLSVVMKLFQLVRPTRSYFGEKDYQQLQLIRGMVTAFFLPIEIVAVPTVRESDGLAMSSRNARLTSSGRLRAPLIRGLAGEIPSIPQAISELRDAGFEVDYVVDMHERRFVAAKIDGVRLIDNFPIPKTPHQQMEL